MGKWTNMKKMIIIGVLAAIVLLFLILSGFSLHKTADRPSVAYPLSAEIKKRIVAETMGKDESELIEYALNLTAKSLQFAAKNDIEGGSANCVGYASIRYAAIKIGQSLDGYVKILMSIYFVTHPSTLRQKEKLYRETNKTNE